MTHEIPNDIRNSDIEYCINEYVRNIEHRKILYEHWFCGKTFEELAGDHYISVTAVKKVIYDIGDRVLVKAGNFGNKPPEILQIFTQILSFLKKVENFIQIPSNI